MKSMVKLIVCTILVAFLFSGIHADASSSYAADSEQLDAYIFHVPGDPSVLQIDDPYQHFYTNEPYSQYSGSEEMLRSVPGFTVNGIDYQFIKYVQTQGYVNVPAFVAKDELDPADVLSLITAAENYPGVVVLGNPTSNYNCHSYAWYSESTNNPYWIINVEIYADDAHTVLRLATETPQPGDICVYRNNNLIVHSAIIDRIEAGTIICRSKWGASVLCEHPIGTVPLEYWESSAGPNCVIMRITPHEWQYSSVGENQHSRSCTICGAEDTLNCEYEYTYFYDDMHNASCKYCDNGYSGAFCTFDFTSNGDGTHTGTCVCGNTQTYSCYMEYTNVSNATHSGSCVTCGYSVSAQQCTLVYEQNGGQSHTVSCTKCENRRTQNCSHRYVSHGDNTHSYLCSLCGYVKIDHAACLFDASNICRFCRTPKNGAVINKHEEVTPE